jgi:S1-C subfamily serine protease
LLDRTPRVLCTRGVFVLAVAPGRLDIGQVPTEARVTIELKIHPDAPDERVEVYDQDLITIGRSPSCDVRFDLGADLDVSTRHAEIRRADGKAVIADLGSTNGTWLNGAPLREPQRLHAGDIINIGKQGPRIRVLQVGTEIWRPTEARRGGLPPVHDKRPASTGGTKEVVAAEVDRRTRGLGRAIIGVAAVGLGFGVAGWMQLRNVVTDSPDIWREVTMPAVGRANEDAVALIDVEIAGTPCARGCEGTGFSIDPSGLLVTNRHVIEQNGRPATRVRVKFANTSAWLDASVLGVHPDTTVDLALLRLRANGRYPTVAGVSESGLDLPVGSSVLAIGFPLGTTLRMDAEGGTPIARTSMTTGAVAKSLDDLIQIDASATHGSSGSPVFDRHGHAIGVVTGGAQDAARRIVYSVPASRITELVAAAPGVAPRN